MKPSHPMRGMTRRDFLRLAGLSTAGPALAAGAPQATPTPVPTHGNELLLKSTSTPVMIQHYQNQTLLEQINRAYQDEPDPTEQQRLEAMRRLECQSMKDQWFSG